MSKQRTKKKKYKMAIVKRDVKIIAWKMCKRNVYVCVSVKKRWKHSYLHNSMDFGGVFSFRNSSL